MDFVQASGTITFDSANDGPAITLTDSTLELYDSSISNLPEYWTIPLASTDLTLSGESTLLAINSYISADFGPVGYTHNAIVLNDISHAYLYGATFCEYTGEFGPAIPAIRAAGTPAVPAVPLTRGVSDTTTGSLSSLASVDGQRIQVLPSQSLEIDTWDVDGLSDTLPVGSASVIATYSVAPSYSGSRAIQWARQGTAYADTSIVPAGTDSPGTERLYDLPLTAMANVGDIRNLNLRFANTAGTGFVEFDRIWIVFTVGADAFIYRWLNATIGDEYGVPTPNSQVLASFTGATELQGQQAIYYSPGSVSTTPPVDVLAYMGETASTYSVTKSDGKTTIPYLTDIITTGDTADSYFVGSYDLTGINGTYISSQTFSFPAYPAMNRGDQSFDVTISLIGLSAFSPDQSRWLVVPVDAAVKTLEINDMTFYHSGDIIVAAGGTLSLKNSVLRLMQPSPYTRTIYVDGTNTQPARVVFQNSMVDSQYPINMIVKGDGILEAYDTVILGVDIIIEENAHVLLSNVTMTGKITTAWDSWARDISIIDSVLVQVPVLSGSVVAGFTNTSAPAIEVTDDAVALIYRWIHVTVLDGTGMPLPGVNVSTRYYVNHSLAGWAMTSSALDCIGVAKVHSLSTRITSTGLIFLGNYWVNASYTYPPLVGMSYYALSNISLGVLPYTEPLGREDTFATMSIPPALSDLTVDQAHTPVWTNIPNPRLGDNVTVYGRINNTGVASAYNITVEFFDDLNGDSLPEAPELFATTTVPMIMAGFSAVVSAYWTATEPIDPVAHRLLVVADRANLIPEIDDAPAIGLGMVTVESLPDIMVTAGTPDAPGIYASTDFVIVGIQCYLLANIYNIGTNTSTQVNVDFYDGTSLIGSAALTGIPPNGNYMVASVPWLPTVPNEDHSIRVVATLMGGYEEMRYDNNQDTVLIRVYDHPNLVLSSIMTIPALSVPVGGTVTVKAQLQNVNDAPFVDPVLELNVTWSGGSISPIFWTLYGVVLSSTSGQIEVTQSFIAPFMNMTTQLEITLRVNPYESPKETTYVDNIVITAIADIIFDQPPVAEAGNDQNVAVDEEVWLNGTGSSDDIGIVNYTWTFEYDGSNIELFGEEVNFTFQIEGVYNITLTVTDNMGQKSNDTVHVTVQGVIPEFPALLLPISGLLLLVIVTQFRRRQILRRRLDSNE